MDRTETYIKMSDCPEIQAKTPTDGVGGTFVGGNFIYHTQSNWDKQNDGAPEGTYWIMDEEYSVECETCGNKEEHHRIVKCVWLPRQEDLQKMIDWNDYQLIARFAEFVHHEAGLGSSPYKSMEQLWLSFWMKEKYNKVWDGENWKEN